MKLKTVLIILVILFVTGLIIKNRIITEQNNVLKSDKERLIQNNLQLINDTLQYAQYRIKQGEWVGSIIYERDSLAKLLKTRKKDIIKITHTDIKLSLTIEKNIPTELIKPNVYAFTDTINKCTVYKGEIHLTNTAPFVKRTLFYDQNRVSLIHYRDARRFLGIRIGKWKNYVQVGSDCGEAKVEEFEFIKKMKQNEN